MAGTLQAAFMNQRSFGEPAPTVIGQVYGGGFYAGSISTTANGVATHYLVTAPKSSGQSQLKWKNVSTATPGAGSDIDGIQNTADMVADGNSTVYPCAHFCNDLTVGGYSDWYMPAFNEVEICYFNLKAYISDNNTSSGINPNAVPARASNYTISNPARTSAAAFQASSGAQYFSGDYYWSSTELQVNTTRARTQGFYDGTQANAEKGGTFSSFRFRAVRRVPV